MPYGGFSPIRRYGSARGGQIEALARSLLASRGPAIDQTRTDTVAWVECVAYARALWECYETATRACNQLDPDKLTDFLPRWERIFRLSPPRTATLASRRAAVKAKWQIVGMGLAAGVLQSLVTALEPDMAPTVHRWTSSEATTHTYTAVSVPGGVTTTADGMWGSSIHLLTVICTPVAGETTQQTMTRLEHLRSAIDRALPGWGKACVCVKNSAAALGFKLDEPNLNYEAFA